MAAPVNPRSYDASRRREEGARTRQRIIDAARDLVTARGYQATTVAAIARAAGVHVDTVYALVGRKPQLIIELIEQALSGTTAVVAGEDRDHVRQMRAASSAIDKLAIYARAMRETQARLAPLFVALRDASRDDPEAKTIWRDISDRRAANMRRLVADIAGTGQLRPELSIDEAADTVWATNSPEMYVMLVDERRWTPEHYEHWLNDIWRRVLLVDGAT